MVDPDAVAVADARALPARGRARIRVVARAPGNEIMLALFVRVLCCAF